MPTVVSTDTAAALKSRPSMMRSPRLRIAFLARRSLVTDRSVMVAVCMRVLSERACRGRRGMP